MGSVQHIAMAFHGLNYPELPFFTTVRKRRQHSFDILKAFSFDTHQSIKRRLSVTIRRDEKSFLYIKIMLPLFRAVLKFYSTNRLITILQEILWTRVFSLLLAMFSYRALFLFLILFAVRDF